MGRAGKAEFGAAWVDRVRRDLAAWYEAGHRDLPWRRDRDPYRILVSEAMLVQTTVAAVIPYFERFLARFPTVEALAAADEADVLKAWEGLGYYRRARQLQSAARAVVDRHGGRLPETAEELLALPGVGPYIAGAILSFAFDRPAPIVEANTQRVLARLIAWEGDLKTTASRRRLWEVAADLVPPEGAGRFNQAIMELGATVCSPREPMCLVCPVASECRARSLGLQDAIPTKSARAAPQEVFEATFLVERDGRFLIVRRGPGRLWEGFWEFPTLHVSGPNPAGRPTVEDGDLAEGLRRLSGVVARVGPSGESVRFGVTRYRVELSAHRAAWTSGEPTPGPGLVEATWARPDEFAARTWGSAMRKLTGRIDLGGARRGRARMKGGTRREGLKGSVSWAFLGTRNEPARASAVHPPAFAG